MRERGEFMVRVDAQFDQNELRKLTDALKDIPKECKSGLVSAVNKSVKSTNTAMQKAITQRYNIKKQSLTNGDFESASSSKLITVHQATKSSLNADILIESHRLSFNVKRGMVSPVTPKSYKGKTMKQIKRMSSPKVKVLKGKSKAPVGGASLKMIEFRCARKQRTENCSCDDVMGHFEKKPWQKLSC